MGGGAILLPTSTVLFPYATLDLSPNPSSHNVTDANTTQPSGGDISNADQQATVSNTEELQTNPSESNIFIDKCAVVV